MADDTGHLRTVEKGWNRLAHTDTQIGVSVDTKIAMAVGTHIGMSVDTKVAMSVGSQIVGA